ncbi:hypothetical protein HGA34_02390 [Candidatus Falkowbacteria bacterium]|nr:hypothetical protein [Candidatus Falkowbacteria bacterium]
MLKLIKTIHTLIWVIMSGSNFVAFYFAFMGRFDAWFYVPAALLSVEILVILFNSWKCPVTTIAEKYTSERKANFDIYLPEWLAKYNVRIFSILIIIEIVIVFIKHKIYG